MTTSTPAGSLATALAEVQADAALVDRHFAAAARKAAAEGRDGDADRLALLLALPPHEVADHAMRLYRQGDTSERLAVLRALPVLDDSGRPDPVRTRCLPIVRDALRTNDTRLVAAALGIYSARHLDDASWRHGVLKALFVGIPVADVAGLAERADAELRRMVLDYSAERVAAGRDISADVDTVLSLCPEQHPEPSPEPSPEEGR